MSSDRSAEWAAKAVAEWYPNGRQTTPHYGTALHAGRTGAVDAERQLDQLILDKTQPAIARASALLLLTQLCVAGLRTCHQGGDRGPGSNGPYGGAQALPPSPPRA